MEIKRIDPTKFVDEGYLQELNRRFLHPLGLALEVVVDENHRPVGFGGVWDFRNDPEGIVYADGVADSEKANRIRKIEEVRKSVRIERLGYWIQPVVENRRV